MASPEVVELSREAYAVLAHVMLDEQIACGGHDDEEAIRECFRRVEEHFEIVKKLEQDLETLNDLGPEFRMTDADHRGATWERQYQEAEDALERWIHENDGPSF